MRRTGCAITLLLGWVTVGLGAVVEESQTYVHPATAVTVVGGLLRLPAQGLCGIWTRAVRRLVASLRCRCSRRRKP